jgi:hypothetical protein
MADTSPLADLLDRAGNVFSLAWHLGRTFQEERETGRIDPTAWDRHKPAFDEFCAAVLDLRGAMQNPPDGFAPVAAALLKAASVAKRIRDVMQTADGRDWATFRDFFPELNSVAVSVQEAIREVTKVWRAEDPFAFVDQPAASRQPGIDTTPTCPKPPLALIELAERRIPGILANVQPNRDRAIELIASHLAKRLQYARHTLAAAQWAIHHAIKAGRLCARRVEAEFPSVGVPGPGGMDWHGGGRGHIAIPQGKPAPFDSFKVVATESLWAWWRSSVDAEEPLALEAAVNNLDPTEAHNDESHADAIDRSPPAPGATNANTSALPAEQLVATVDALVDFVRARVEVCLQKGGADHARLHQLADHVWTLVVQLGLQTCWPDSSPGYGPTRLPVFWLAAGEGLVISRAEFPRWETSMKTLRRCAEGLRRPPTIHAKNLEKAAGSLPPARVTKAPVGNGDTEQQLEPRPVPANDPPFQPATPAGGQPQAETTPATPTDHPSVALLKVFTNGIADDRIKQASRLLTDDALTVNEKLAKIDALIHFPATASAEKLGDLLGVTKQAVLKTEWWTQNRKGEKDNEIGRRRAGHQKRAKEYDKPDATDDDR